MELPNHRSAGLSGSFPIFLGVLFRFLWRAFQGLHQPLAGKVLSLKPAVERLVQLRWKAHWTGNRHP